MKTCDNCKYLTTLNWRSGKCGLCQKYNINLYGSRNDQDYVFARYWECDEPVEDKPAEYFDFGAICSVSDEDSRARSVYENGEKNE